MRDGRMTDECITDGRTGNKCITDVSDKREDETNI